MQSIKRGNGFLILVRLLKKEYQEYSKVSLKKLKRLNKFKNE